MATQRIRLMERHAAALLARSAFWAKGTRNRDGLRTYQFTSSRQNADGSYAVYFTSVIGCTCPGWYHRGECSHQLACIMKSERDARQAEKPRHTYEELWGDNVSAF